MRSVFYLLLSALAFAQAANIHDRAYYEAKFIDWQKQFSTKIESGAEWVRRLNIFAENDDTITRHNSEGHEWTLGHNQFSHLTADEFKQYIGRLSFPYPSEIQPYVAPNTVTPNDIDWSTLGAVTPVKDQGQCGSCWAFSTTGALEGAYFLKTGQLQSFSEQQLVDCSGAYGNYGCSGGWPYAAVQWQKANGGAASESSYPYRGVDSACQKVASVAGSAPTGYYEVKNEADLESAVAQRPVSVCIDVVSSFQLYKSGVYSGPCGTQLNHAVLAVGYGNSAGTPYWKVKNSWGTSWGDQGYILMKKGVGICGIATKAMFPTL